MQSNLAWNPILGAAVLGQMHRSDEDERAIYELKQLKPDLCRDVTLLQSCLGGFIPDKDVQQLVVDGLEKAGLHLK